MSTNILVIDIETTGLPKTYGWDMYYSYKDIKQYDSCRVIQLSWAEYTSDGTLIDDTVHDYILNPNDIHTITNTNIHGITIEDLRTKGVSWEFIIPQLKNSIQHSYKIVSHNIKFDLNVLSSELYRQELTDVIDMLCDIPTLYCTMEEGKYITNIKLSSGYLKNPKLTELYKELFDKDLHTLHNSKYDVIHTAKCYFKMISC